jgi:hypothetical protein
LRTQSLVPLIAYALATWLTNARIMGDTVYYVDSILRVRAGGQKFSYWEPLGNYSFFEFGHLLWRPFGYLVAVLCEPLAGVFGGAAATDGRARVTLVLVGINWLAGLACVLLWQGLLRRLRVSGWASVAATISLICAHGFLNFAQTGSSYIPALASLLLGMYVLARAGARVEAGSVWPAALLAGGALGCAVGFWFLFALAIPAALLLPLIFFGDERRRRLLIAATAVSCAAFVLSMYLFVVMLGLGITDVATFKAWVVSSSHGLANNRGVPQVVLGLARSFIEIGNDHLIFKRFLLRDPYNVVSLFDLFRLSLWKLGLFYLAFAAVVFALLRERAGGWRVLALFGLSGAPVLAFAGLWQGTPTERYLPFYPAFFLALAYALRSGARARWVRPVVLAFMVLSVVSNLSALSVRRLNRVPEAVTARTRELMPLLKPQSIVVEVLEELNELQWAYPLHPLNRVLRVYSAISLGATNTAEWREDFARQTLLVWRDGGDVWLSKRVLEPRPRAESSWVEGADPRVRWTDIPAFFSQLEAGQTTGDRDGFVLVARTPRNEQFLSALAAQTK